MSNSIEFPRSPKDTLHNSVPPLSSHISSHSRENLSRPSSDWWSRNIFHYKRRDTNYKDKLKMISRLNKNCLSNHDYDFTMLAICNVVSWMIILIIIHRSIDKTTKLQTYYTHLFTLRFFFLLLWSSWWYQISDHKPEPKKVLINIPSISMSFTWQ